ncbi:unnamed protein product [Arctogadus glacialis]
MDIFYTHGAPEVILTEQGHEFWNKVNKSLFEEFGVTHRITSAYHPQVTANIEKAQERQKESYKRRSKRETKCFRITPPGMEALKKNERKRGRPGHAMDPDWPTVYR